MSGHECNRAPLCAREYQSKISGPLLDRIDIHVFVPAVSPWQIFDKNHTDTSQNILQRVIQARKIQKNRFIKAGYPHLSTNSELNSKMLDDLTEIDEQAKQLLIQSADKFKLSARGYHRTLRLARTIADLQNETKVLKIHVAEALNYRRVMPTL